MKTVDPRATRCAIYTRVSTDAGLEQDFNSLDAQREASEAYIKSQTHEGWKLIRTAYDDGGFSGGSLVRPALQRLLEDIRNRRVDVIVVYKVDRLTRSLADFAKLVELFDAHGVSFVSVTQSFNTTTSMGRLTLNMLLSFAQFERDVTSERIRDKVAASKKKGIWMGGSVPLGYRVQDRKLIVVPDEAATVRQIFACYLEQGSILKLLEELRRRGIKTRQRVLSDGRTTGGIFFTPGPINHLLRNRIYIGEIVHKDQSYPGEHDGIIDQALFDAVRARLASNLKNHRAKRAASNALLLGRLFDDAGNRMTPSTARKHGLIHRYYVSRALLEGRKSECGSHPRVAADQIETLVIDALKARLASNGAGEDGGGDARAILQSVQRIVVQKGNLRVELTDAADSEDTDLEIPWAPRGPGRPKREVLEPALGVAGDDRPMRSEVRATLVRAIALGRLWLQELTGGKVKDTEEIAIREDRSKRSVHMTMSLAFLAPDIVEAAINGTLPRRIGITRLADLPPSWRKQREMLGLRQSN
ncbi:MAG: recombinase family protein [Terriglobia bacterium]|nr:recombinase family protein [Terriglobia bacterium]